MPTERPTWGDIKAMLEDRRTSVYGQMHADMGIDEDYQNWAWAPGGNAFAHSRMKGFDPKYQFKLMPWAWIAVMTMTDNVMTAQQPDVISKVPSGLHRDEATEKKHLEALTTAGKALMYTICTYTSENPLVDFVMKAGGLGLGTLYYPLDYDNWPDYPYKYKNGDQRKPRNERERKAVDEWKRKRSTGFPWDVRSIHSNHVMPDPDHDPPHDVLIEEEISARSAARNMPDRYSGSESSSTKVKRVIYCCEDWYGIWYDDVPFLTAKDGADEDGIAPNRTHINWFNHAWSGLGSLDRTGNYASKGQGVIRNVRHLIDEITASANVLAHSRQIAVFPKVVAHPTAPATFEDAKAVEEAWRWEATTMTALPEGITIEVIMPPPIPPVIFQELDRYMPLLEMILGPEILRGMARSETAAGQAQRVGLAQQKYARIKHNCDQAVASMLTNMFLMIKNELQEEMTWGPLPGDVARWAAYTGKQGPITIKPEDIPDGFMFYVNFAPPTNEQRAFRIEEGLKLRQRDPLTGEPNISRYTLQTDYLNIADPTAEDQAIFEEDAEALPIVKQMLGQIIVNHLTKWIPKAQQDMEETQPIPPLDQTQVAQGLPGNGARPLPEPAQVSQGRYMVAP